ncbi:hypothetical protein QL285_033482 [Trifolium repens]|nr:hypothetical protein QL285_033482 [Trifolium repens]
MIEDFELRDNEWLKGLFDERFRWVPIKEIKNEFTSKETSPDIIEEDGSVPNQETKILDSKVARSKGRPPFKRMTSKADQIVKKIAKKKRIQIRGKKRSRSKRELVCI